MKLKHNIFLKVNLWRPNQHHGNMALCVSNCPYRHITNFLVYIIRLEFKCMHWSAKQIETNFCKLTAGSYTNTKKKKKQRKKKNKTQQKVRKNQTQAWETSGEIS